MNSRDISKLAMTLIGEEERLREIELKSAACVVIQSAWRGQLTRRKWLVMKRGFEAMQKLYRKRLQGKEGDLWKKLRESENEFQAELEILKERRQTQEAIYRDLQQTPASKLTAFFIQDFHRDASSSWEDSLKIKVPRYTF